MTDTPTLPAPNVAEAERLLAKATPGPWAVDDDERPGMSWNAHIVADDGGDMRIAFMTHDGTQANSECLANAALIVYAVNNLPALLSRVAALETERDEAVKGLQWYANPEIYKPHPHGIAFDDRDLSFHAKAVLGRLA